MTRPSTKRAVMVSSVTSTCVIRDSTLIAVLMPCLDDLRFVPNNRPTNLVQLARAEAMIPRQGNWGQPELRMRAVAPHVDVHRLVAVANLRHSASLRLHDVKVWRICQVRLTLALDQPRSHSMLWPERSNGSACRHAGPRLQ